MNRKLVVGKSRGGPIRSWSDLVHAFESVNKWGWVFRGHGDSTWDLQSSFERAVLEFALPARTTNVDVRRKALKGGLVHEGSRRSAVKVEAGLVRRFKRECHHHTTQLPMAMDMMEWLSLMQHYGAPTRLLDWTYSFYAAAFFAVDGASPALGGATCSIWAVNADWLRDRFREQYPRLWRIVDRDKNLHKYGDTFRRVFQAGAAFVCPVSPYRLNDRLIIQQGLFLCPGDASRPFADNLAELQYIGRGPKLRPDARHNIRRFDISLDLDTRLDILRTLHRMNMTRASLYPGLPGFAQSLKNMLVFPKMLESGPKYE